MSGRSVKQADGCHQGLSKYNNRNAKLCSIISRIAHGMALFLTNADKEHDWRAAGCLARRRAVRLPREKPVG